MIPRKLAVCGLFSALCVVMMLLGSIFGLGIYAVPMLISLILAVPGNKYGRGTHLLLWSVVGVLSLILVPELEQSLMFLLIFGPYPILYPFFQKQRLILRLVGKFLYFNITVLLVEAIVFALLFPDGIGALLAAALLLLGNVIFFCYDHLIPRANFLMQRYLKKYYDKL